MVTVNLQKRLLLPPPECITNWAMSSKSAERVACVSWAIDQATYCRIYSTSRQSKKTNKSSHTATRTQIKSNTSTGSVSHKRTRGATSLKSRIHRNRHTIWERCTQEIWLYTTRIPSRLFRRANVCRKSLWELKMNLHRGWRILKAMTKATKQGVMRPLEIRRIAALAPSNPVHLAWAN